MHNLTCRVAINTFFVFKKSFDGAIRAKKIAYSPWL